MHRCEAQNPDFRRVRNDPLWYGAKVQSGGHERPTVGRQQNLAKNFDSNINLQLAPSPTGGHRNGIARGG
jgi:hypothetical protein